MAGYEFNRDALENLANHLARLKDDLESAIADVRLMAKMIEQDREPKLQDKPLQPQGPLVLDSPDE
jgi:hypothetical protein